MADRDDNRHKIDTFKTSIIRGSFFILKIKECRIMDINKLFHKVIEDEDVKDIPLVFVLMVINSVIEAINSGDCFYKTECD